MFGRSTLLMLSIVLAACSGNAPPAPAQPDRAPAPDGLFPLTERQIDPAPLYPNETPELRALIEEYATFYDVPVALVQRVVVRESTHRPEARNGPYYGLMQIHPQTARSMGHRGAPEELLDSETNLRYAVKYLRGAWLLADGSHERAVQLYAQGYYYEARDRGMLEEVGLR